jgi:iron complex transport system substrate-binding protein
MRHRLLTVRDRDRPSLGLGDELVGRSHLCDYPDDVDSVPVVTAAARDSAPALDITLLAHLEPDLVLAAGDHDPSPLGSRSVRGALRARGVDATVVGLDPRSLEGIFNSISTVGAFAEAEDEAVGLVELLREGLGRLENRVLERRLEGIASRRVVVLGAMDAPLQSGRWVPEMVRRAGGWELLGREGEEPESTSWERVREIEPEVIGWPPDVTLPGVAALLAAARLMTSRMMVSSLWTVQDWCTARPHHRRHRRPASLRPRGLAGLVGRSVIPWGPWA